MHTIIIASRTVMENPGNMSNLDMLVLFGILMAIAFSAYALALLRMIFICAWAAVSVIVKYMIVGALVAIAVWSGTKMLRLIGKADDAFLKGKVMKVVNTLKEG